ncbi:high affinity cationic amino acid transporter 1 [Condylostylus longicornis]|uniref:high affinity cationic amino acid transporter 1 n=1 Tax=Condylostylus longicornis TaxID=2530218 RepID=UPI00244DEE1E|nr:high affinity cationic amino acid transporter 1 [Condylostylus longicornis]
MSQLSYWKVLTRKKTLTHDHETETNLNRVLGTYDLTALGVGATLGVGVYVLAGHVAKDQAGPSVIISFLIAALASLLAGLCYAEFGARVPKAGSAYIYSYVCIGEFAAFIIGWNLILEYVIGSASVCRGISLYLDTLLNNTLKVTFSEVTPIDWGFLGAYFDFFAFALAIIFGVGIAFGIQASAVLNNFCTLINIGVVVFVIVAGSIKADIKNWQIDPSEINNSTLDEGTKLGSGGFFPFGFGGTLRGAATCFFGFVGFDCIATTGEEVKEPRRAIPRAILFSLLIIFLSYFGVSTVLTLMWPYYLQNIDAPLPYAFEQIGWEVAKWIVTIGGMLGLIASLLGALLPLPRIIYAMSQDGLIFKFLGIINKRFKTPVIASICAAFLTGFFAGLFDLTQLVNMLSIGTLLAYTVIAICLTILRFMDNSNEYSNIEYKRPNNNEDTILVNNNYSSSSSQTTCRHIVIQIFNLKRNRIPSSLSTTIVTVMLLIYCACAFGFSLTVMYASEEILNLAPWAITLLCLFGLINIFITFAISIQPREEENPYFKVPLVPLTPAISIFVNIYLMLQLDMYTWIRFGIWMIIGLLLYSNYGIKNSYQQVYRELKGWQKINPHQKYQSL